MVKLREMPTFQHEKAQKKPNNWYFEKGKRPKENSGGQIESKKAKYLEFGIKKAKPSTLLPASPSHAQTP